MFVSGLSRGARGDNTRRESVTGDVRGWERGVPPYPPSPQLSHVQTVVMEPGAHSLHCFPTAVTQGRQIYDIVFFLRV